MRSFGAVIRTRMKFDSELAVSLLDFEFGRRRGHLQGIVIYRVDNHGCGMKVCWSRQVGNVELRLAREAAHVDGRIFAPPQATPRRHALSPIHSGLRPKAEVNCGVMHNQC